ncbi:alcohol dehydrogenase catalytic domain-containing protein [Nocardia salmonicida]|uniref:alcohol dehydrogenase catalytic domain-containing protein n=1 Tax=Nocardia salmonicida TaxID=53431 RepID=UPI0007A393F3|nr:alcohol dehydrogenase catalytic domain-containing protein [Nocardia salmonicida]
MIDIEYCGICHSDIHIVRGDWGPRTYPLCPGHEIAEIVSASGTAVTKHRVGDRVGVGCVLDSCRTCANCRKGAEQYCLAGHTATYGSIGADERITQGGYSSRMVVTEDFVLKIPDSIAIDEKLATLEQAAKLLADAAKGIVTPLTEHNDALSTMREDIGKQVAAAAVEIGAAIVMTAVIVGVAAFLTAGVGAVAAGAGGTAVTIEIVESTAVIIKNTVTVSRMVTAVGAVITIGVASGGFTAIPDLTQAGLSAAVGAIAGMAVYIAADEAADDEPVWDSTEERTRNPAQDKILTDKDIMELKSRGHDPHDVKPDPPSRYDLYKDGKGNVYIKPKGGKGPGDPTGIRLQ